MENDEKDTEQSTDNGHEHDCIAEGFRSVGFRDLAQLQLGHRINQCSYASSSHVGMHMVVGRYILSNRSSIRLKTAVHSICWSRHLVGRDACG